MSLHIKDLHISVDHKEIVHGLDLEVPKGEVHTLMGPNGSGKSTLANTLAGHPKYEITKGTISLDGKDIGIMSPDERAKAGLFLSMQYTPEIPGVTIANFLRLAYSSMTEEKVHPLKFHKVLVDKVTDLGMDPDFLKRYLNVGFSGGEKKRLEILQMAVLDPTFVVLDETDSGLDVDALRIVADGINRFKSEEKGVLMITHYNRLLEYVVPDVVHIMIDGKIVKSGGADLAKVVEEEGYANLSS